MRVVRAVSERGLSSAFTNGHGISSRCSSAAIGGWEIVFAVRVSGTLLGVPR